VFTAVQHFNEEKHTLLLKYFCNSEDIFTVCICSQISL